MVQVRAFFVWRRHPDGHVGRSAYKPGRFESPGSKYSYDILGVFDDWYEALHLLLTERDSPDVDVHLEKNCTLCWRALDAGEVVSEVYGHLKGVVLGKSLEHVDPA